MKESVSNFLKGIVIGIGGISPGLSGSVMMVIFGLYEKCINAIGTIFKNFKKNLIFLIPLFAGFGVGILLFSKVVEFLLDRYEMYTRFAFLGLVIGTIPLFYKQVKKKDFKNKNYILMAISFAIGIVLMLLSKDNEGITDPNILQSMFLGVAVACSTIIPGVDSAVILSSLGLYNTYVSSISNLNISVLIPAAFGLGIGGLVVSYFMNKLLEKHHSVVFSIIFGLFIAIIPSVLEGNMNIGFNSTTYISLIFMIVGFIVSFTLGRIEDIVKDKKE